MRFNAQPHPLTRALRRLRGAFWRRRVARWLIRATWLALLVPTIAMAGYLWLDWSVSLHIWLPLMLLVGVLSLLWSTRPINLKKMARRLDNLLGLRAQLITGFEVSYAPGTSTHPDNPVVEQLIHDTVNLTVDLRKQVGLFDRGFWLELRALFAVVALLGAMLILDLLTPLVPEAVPVELPPAWQEPGADQVIPPNPRLFPPPFQQEIQTLSEEELQAALQALADALRDQAVTRAIAEAIDRGALGEAAEALRRLADQVGDLSEQARRELGDSLQEAADNIGDGVPSLTQPLQIGSNALGNDNLNQAGQAMEDLAEVLDTIDETPPENGQPEAGSETEEPAQPELEESEESGEQVGDANSGAGDGVGEEENSDRLLEEETERLPIDGQPLELESDLELEDRVLQPAELEAEPGEERTSDSPFARQPLNASGDDLGPDPLTYPWEKREIIRQYFTP